MNGSHDISQAQSFSRNAVHLQMCFNDTELATGSGVIVPTRFGLHHLVTAWHNLSGRDPLSGKAISPTGGLPNRVKVKGCNLSFQTSLYGGDNDPNTAEPLFPTHDMGSQVDVTVLRLPAGVIPWWPLDMSFLRRSQNEALPLRVGQTCFIIGFPEGLIHEPFENATLPIWKTGHIASEPAFAFQGLPRLVIDATTRRGMSGAIVVVKQSIRNRLVGIYTGRYRQRVDEGDVENSKHFTAELGWVFWTNVINELVEISCHP
jgi:hypothetical protein